MRLVAPSKPSSLAIICSTGPPGAAWMMMKLISRMPNSVGMISNRRRKIYASILLLRARRCGVVRGGFLLRASPPGVQADVVFGGDFRVLEAVPVGHAPGLDVPVGDDVMAPQQHAVEGPGVGDQALPGVGVDQAFDQLVDGWVFQADEVAAAGVVGAARVPVLALLVTRRIGLAEAAHDQVEIPRAQAVDVLRDIDPANHQFHAEIGHVALERQQYALEFGLREEKLETDRFAFGIEHQVAFDAPAGFLQQLIGAPLLFADDAAAVGDGNAEFIGKHRGGNLVAQRFEELQLVGAGQAAGGQFGVVEITAGAGIGTIEQLALGPFEIEQQAQRLAHPFVLEQGPAGVEDEALHAGGVVVVDLFLDQLAIGHGGAVVGGGPVFRTGFQPIVELPGLQGFEGHGVVAVVVELHGVEVVETAVDRQVLAPPVLDPLIANRAPGFDFGNLVGAAAQRNLQIALAEVAFGPPVLGQYRQLSENQRQFAVAGMLEDKAYPARAFDFDPRSEEHTSELQSHSNLLF